MGNVRLSHLADGDLDAIRNHVKHQNPGAADRLLEHLFEVLELLANQPLIGQQRDDLAVKLRAFTMHPYVILYYAREDGIHVARIVHGARDYPAMFAQDVRDEGQ